LTTIPIELPLREYALVRHRDRHATVAQQALVAHLFESGNELALAPVAR
jgi:hypothetical protein